MNTAELNAAETALETRRTHYAQAKPAAFPYSETLRVQLLDYTTKNKLTRGQLAKQMGVGETQVIKYLNAKADWDTTKFELIAGDLLRTAAKRELFKAEIFATSVTKQVNAVCETIRKTNDFGLVHSAAGWGKSSGMHLYCATYANAVGLTVHRWTRTATDQVRLLWEVAGPGPREKYRGGTHATWLKAKFENSHRPLLIDNAHRLTPGALQYWFDFHDATGVPVIFFGNPEVMDQIAKNDQMFSRLGLIEMVELKQSEYEGVARQLIQQVLHEQVEELEDLAQEAIDRKGHLRTLRKQLSLAREIREGNKGVDWRNAFKAAGTKLVRQEKDSPATKAGR